MPRIKVPAALAGGAGPETVSVQGETLRDILDNHAAEHGPTLRESVVAGDEIKEFINVFVDGEPVESLETALDPDSLIRVIPAASGG